MKIMDCTLRDGANVVGNGFSAELTERMLRGPTKNHYPIIEFGNAKGIGADKKGFPAPLTDEEYLQLAQPFLDRAEIGMFLNAKRYEPENVELAAQYGPAFLRCGSDAGDAHLYTDQIRDIKDHGIKAYFSQMKAYILPPEKLAEEARLLEDTGIDEITLMDPAGCMFPEEVSAAVEAMKKAVKVPIGFHCHANMGMCAANAMAAWRSGADILDCGRRRCRRDRLWPAGHGPQRRQYAHRAGHRIDADTGAVQRVGSLRTAPLSGSRADPGHGTERLSHHAQTQGPHPGLQRLPLRIRQNLYRSGKGYRRGSLSPDRRDFCTRSKRSRRSAHASSSRFIEMIKRP